MLDRGADVADRLHIETVQHQANPAQDQHAYLERA